MWMLLERGDDWMDAPFSCILCNIDCFTEKVVGGKISFPLSLKFAG